MLIDELNSKLLCTLNSLPRHVDNCNQYGRYCQYQFSCEITREKLRNVSLKVIVLFDHLKSNKEYNTKVWIDMCPEVNEFVIKLTENIKPIDHIKKIYVNGNPAFMRGAHPIYIHEVSLLT